MRIQRFISTTWNDERCLAQEEAAAEAGATFQLWEKLKYEGFFHVEWLLVKDVPNYVFTGVKMSYTPTKKSITSCRDCEEVLFEEVRWLYRNESDQAQLH
ncbi:unnamed protein product [Phytophthora lilii]|uniref:Unnamed protein product n=1 Tax=Phytophthora lilii TaxID=2077276 RepID=A0A9W6XD60_9STRA|nr:unnamed protein product [Phytophthora lilii]